MLEVENGKMVSLAEKGRHFVCILDIKWWLQNGSICFFIQ